MNGDRSREIGKIIEAIGAPEFSDQLATALGNLVPFNYSVMFAYCGRASPQ